MQDSRVIAVFSILNFPFLLASWYGRRDDRPVFHFNEGGKGKRRGAINLWSDCYGDAVSQIESFANARTHLQPFPWYEVYYRIKNKGENNKTKRAAFAKWIANMHSVITCINEPPRELVCLFEAGSVLHAFQNKNEPLAGGSKSERVDCIYLSNQLVFPLAP